MSVDLTVAAQPSRPAIGIAIEQGARTRTIQSKTRCRHSQIIADPYGADRPV